MNVVWNGREIDVPDLDEGLTRDGYHLVYRPDHPGANAKGYIRAHRYVMAQMLGRPLRKDEHVHHKDGNRLNNHPSNLELTTRGTHEQQHALARWSWKRREEWREKWKRERISPTSPRDNGKPSRGSRKS
ncbi:MAG: HNH endonuclease [Anaerolineae bacterium]